MDTTAEKVTLKTMDIPFEKLPAGKSGFAVMGRPGDTKHIWDKTKPDEVAAARVLFDSLTSKRYLAFRVIGKDGTKGEQMTAFDENAERVIFVPAFVGG